MQPEVPSFWMGTEIQTDDRVHSDWGREMMGDDFLRGEEDDSRHRRSPDFSWLCQLERTSCHHFLCRCACMWKCGGVEKSCYFTFTSNCAILIQVVFVRVWFYKSWACKYRQTSQDGTFCCFNKPWNRNRRMNLGGFGCGGPKGPGSSNEAFLSLLNSY